MWRVALVLVVVGCPAAFAGDEREQAPAPPIVPRGGWTPPPSPATPSPSAAATPAQAITPADELRLAEIVDAAVERAMARRSAAGGVGGGGSGVGGYGPVAIPSPQSGYAPARPPLPTARIVGREPVRRIASVPAWSEEREYVTVLMPAGCCRRAAAAVGARLVEFGRPRTRTLRVAPAAVATCAAAPPAAYASPQAD